jgi:predicted secreted protein
MWVILTLLFVAMPSLLIIGVEYVSLSRRIFAIWLCVWIAMLLILLGLSKKLQARREVAPIAENAALPDVGTRGRLIHLLRIRRMWLAILFVLFPFGIAYGISERAWVGTMAGAAVSITFSVLSYLDMRRIRRILDLTANKNSSGASIS